MGGGIGNIGIALGTTLENLITGNGNDAITSNQADNDINTGGGDDTVFASEGSDTINGGGGTDRLVFDFDFSLVTGAVFNGTNMLITAGLVIVDSFEFEFFDFADQNFSFADLQNEFGAALNIAGTRFGDIDLMGGTGDDTIDGLGGNDSILGMAGDDQDELVGGAGNDTLFGNFGDDTLNGGIGDDLLMGGFGSDTFVFTGGHDVIDDFVDGEDLITLSGDGIPVGYSAILDNIEDFFAVDVNDLVLTVDATTSLRIQGITDVNLVLDDITVIL